MYTTNYSFGLNPNPEAYITKGKNRIRQHDGVVYLDNQDQFEIEVFNPKTISVLAKIKLNGNYISNRGLVIKPGQRIHLDRYFDDARKFLFSTYIADGDEDVIKQAIQNNGLVEIEFYDETVLSGMSSTSSGFVGYPWNQPPVIYYNNTNPNPNTITCFDNTANYSAGITYTSDVVGVSASLNTSKRTLTKSIETGRVEKGEKSNTKFKDVNMDFSSYTTHSVTWKILPNSQKPIEVGELRNYCTGCGVRIKKSNWKFCPSCGNQL
jgi:predicted component of type VI protein secretion system